MQNIDGRTQEQKDIEMLIDKHTQTARHILSLSDRIVELERHISLINHLDGAKRDTQEQINIILQRMDNYNENRSEFNDDIRKGIMTIQARIHKLEEHHARQIDENRKISARVDELRIDELIDGINGTKELWRAVNALIGKVSKLEKSDLKPLVSIEKCFDEIHEVKNKLSTEVLAREELCKYVMGKLDYASLPVSNVSEWTMDDVFKRIHALESKQDGQSQTININLLNRIKALENKQNPAIYNEPVKSYQDRIMELAQETAIPLGNAGGFADDKEIMAVECPTCKGHGKIGMIHPE